MKGPVPPDYPLWTSASLKDLTAWYDSIAKPCLAGLAIISSGTAVIGYAGQFDEPSIGIYMRCFAIGFALYLITRAFWAGAWALPALETNRTLSIYALVAVLGFFCFGTVSTLGSLGATGNQISDDITQSENIDQLENFGQEFAAYGGQMAVARAALSERRDEAQAFAEAEINGSGPTGVPGAGPVSNSFYAARGIYAQAGDLLEAALSKLDAHMASLSGVIAEMREVQGDGAMSAAAERARLKALSGQAISEMRALLALDPARAIRASAEILSSGVPEPSRVSGSSRDRIADISAKMKGYAASLRLEADRVAALTPVLPKLVTLSPAEKLISNMWRMPGLTMAAVLIDLCGWIAIGFRVVIYQALKARLVAENADPNPTFITIEDLNRAQRFLEHASEAQKAIEDLRPQAKRGRPVKSLPKVRKDTGKDDGEGEE